MSEYPRPQPLRLLTVNIHKGYNAFNRRMVLHELREAVRAVRCHNHDVSLPGAEPRALLHCVLVRPAGPPELHVMCVHLGLSEVHRRHQLAKVCETVHREVPADAPLAAEIELPEQP